MVNQHKGQFSNVESTAIAESHPKFSSADNKELFKLIVENLEDHVVFATDPSGEIVSWNPGVRRVLGYDEAEFVGQQLSIISTPEDRQCNVDSSEIEAALTKGKSVGQRWHLTKDGTRFWANGITIALRAANGELRGFAKILRDMRAGNSAQETLEAKIEQLRLITDAVPVLIAYVDAEQRYRFTNKAYEAWFGRPREEALGKHISEVIGQVAYEKVRRNVELALKGEEVSFEGLLDYKDGKERFVSMSYEPDFGERGEVRGIVVLVSDISDRKQIENDLREQTEALAVVNAVDQLLSAELDQHKLVQAVTDAATEITGAQFGSFFYNQVDEDGASYMLHTLSGVPQAAFANFPVPRATALFGPTFRGEGTVLIDDVKLDPRFGRNSPYYGLPEGHLPVTSYLAVPVISRSGEVFGGLFFGHSEAGVFKERHARIVEGFAAQTAIAIDNARLFESLQSERTRAEEARLRNSNILESITDAFFAVDHKWRFTYLNRQAEPLLQCTREELLGKNMWDAFPEAAGSSFFEQYNKAMTEQVSVSFEEFYPPLLRWFEIHAYPSQEGLSVYFHDITDRKRHEATRSELLAMEQQARVEAEGASRLKDEFLTTLSHELRTPLTAMLGWTKILMTGTLNPDEFERALQIIDRNAQAQAHIIEDILDISRIMSGKLRLDVQLFDPAVVIQAAVDAVRPAADSKNIRLQSMLDPNAGPVSGDPDRLQQVIWNLLSNAVKFTPKGGRVQVRLARVNSQIEIAVSDNGEGIKPDFIPFVFDRFRQADASTTRRHGGLGLGLSIVKQLVEVHGGTVRVDSPGEGKGAIFTVLLPSAVVRASDRSEDGAMESVHPKTGGRIEFECTPVLEGLHILVVDDEQDARELVTAVLETCMATVTAVSSVSEAIAAIKDVRPDILVSDIGMPEEDGYKLLSKVRALSPEEGGRIPAVALTAYARVEDRMKVLSAGFQMHVPKPVEPAELVAVVASLAGWGKA